MESDRWKWGAWLYWLIDVDDLVFDSLPRVIMYHSIGVENGYGNISTNEFQRHLRWLAQHTDVVDLPAVLDSPDAADKQVAVTFDDGLASFLWNAYPLIQKYQVPCTMFALGASIRSRSGTSNNQQLLERLETPDRLMSEDELNELTEDELVTVGAHTWTHPELPTLQDPELLHTEIVGAKRCLESALDVDIDRFAYPYNESSPEADELVSDTYEYAVLGGGRRSRITAATNPTAIPRIDGGVELERLTYNMADLSIHLRQRDVDAEAKPTPSL